ncbi:unnamed protein product [Ranitomeya imitator]|uniref:Uncharacterized protein n=1 Tax=Ranitomeya imitator TaxID=111125 RepID=A0ABN9KRU2_9NEOB|nr:unnamed protein product [Ranitomeya imitator]
MLLLVFSLPHSFTRQIKGALLPFLTLKFHLFLIVLRGLLRSAWRFIRSKMLATLLVIRQFLQNVKEVSQPHLYQKVQQGDINPRSIILFVRYALRRLVQKYALSQRPARTPGDPLEPGFGNRKKCLNGGCGVPEEEEDGVSEEEDFEEESIMDCGLKLKRVSFLEKEEKRMEESILSQQDDDIGFLQEGSPTLMEKGSDPASVFQLGDDEEDEREISGDMQDVEEQETAVKMRPHRRKKKRHMVEQEWVREGDEERMKKVSAYYLRTACLCVHDCVVCMSAYCMCVHVYVLSAYCMCVHVCVLCVCMSVYCVVCMSAYCMCVHVYVLTS